jgi:hypothetical protein
MYSAKFCDILNYLRLKCLRFTDDFSCANNAGPIILCISSRFLKNRKLYVLFRLLLDFSFSLSFYIKLAKASVFRPDFHKINCVEIIKFLLSLHFNLLTETRS